MQAKKVKISSISKNFKYYINSRYQHFERYLKDLLFTCKFGFKPSYHINNYDVTIFIKNSDID